MQNKLLPFWAIQNLHWSCMCCKSFRDRWLRCKGHRSPTDHNGEWAVHNEIEGGSVEESPSWKRKLWFTVGAIISDTLSLLWCELLLRGCQKLFANCKKDHDLRNESLGYIFTTQWNRVKIGKKWLNFFRLFLELDSLKYRICCVPKWKALHFDGFGE